MNTKHVWRRSLLGIICAFSALTFSASLVQAQNTTINVQIGPVVLDVCPNILGVQATVPSGMIVDGNGDCVNPLPPVVDVCNNIAGDQTTIPVGYFRDVDGNCFIQPTPPVDVCPNIFGLQATVPSSLIVDENGNCIAPPVDECPNIGGPQSTIPDGMVKVDGICFTPTPDPDVTVDPDEEPTPIGSVGPTTPRTNRPTYKNVPTVLESVVEPFVNIVPEELKEFAKSVPANVARTVPYYIYTILAIAALVMIIQALRELFATRALIILLKREKSIAEQKDNFIALASHYLRTPLTLMRNGLDTIVALKELKSDQITPLHKALESLDTNIKAILTDIDSNEALKGINAPPEELDEKKSILKSAFFWLPIIGSLLMTWLANFLLGIVADVELGTANLLFQVIVIVAVSMVFYTAFRNHHIRRKQREHQQRLIEHERTIDSARNSFIHRSTDALQTGLGGIYTTRNVIGNAPSAKFFDEGYLRFNNILEKFLLLGKIEANSIDDIENVNLRQVIDKVLSDMHEKIDDRKLTIDNKVNGLIFVKQNKDLFEFVLQSVIDNAIKFNATGGTITIGADKGTKEMTISISDTGIGIPKDKLAQLFKPFSRADSALQFNYEGLGFSLFLDKIITDYMGGDIIASSTQTKGTNITVRTALKHA
ncbi:MAG: ATP-binding protein [Candidatus Saccharimonadales bacterium]